MRISDWSSDVCSSDLVAVETDGADEADRVFTGLVDGGSVEMPLQKVEWAEKFGICADRFGVQWMVSHTGDVTFGQGSAAARCGRPGDARATLQEIGRATCREHGSL